jgi:hypothetical protein
MVPVKCPECNGAVSSEADKCPHCGNHLSVFIEESLVYQSRWGLRIIFLGLAIAALLLIIRFSQAQLWR